MFGHVTRWLGPYSEGVLSASETSRVASHVFGCRRCRRDLESVREGVRLARTLARGADESDHAWGSATPPLDWSELEPLLDAAPARTAPTRSWTLRWSFPLAASAAAALLLFVVTTGSALDPSGNGGVSPSASLEEAALAAHGAPSLQLRTAEIGILRRWIAERIGPGAALPAPGGRVAVVGASELSGARALAVACRIGGEPVTLVVGERIGAEVRPALKRIVHRTEGELQVSSWTQAGRRYALVSPLRGEAACATCHEQPRGRLVIGSPGAVL